MYFLKNILTGQPIQNPSKTYDLRLLALKEAEKSKEASPVFQAHRVDVVEISESARLYLENQSRLNHSSMRGNDLISSKTGDKRS